MTPIPDPIEKPTLSVEEAAKILGTSRSTAYADAARYLATDGKVGLPVIKVGARGLRVPTAKLRAILGID